MNNPSDTTDGLIFLGGSISGIIAVLLYDIYRKEHKTWEQIKNTEMVQLGPELEKKLKATDNLSIPYASVEGVVTDLGKTISSKNSPKPGVILKSSLTELKSQRIHGFWIDVKHKLRDTFDIATFALRDPDNPSHSIIVTQAAEADELVESLEIIHDRFVPNKSTALKTGIDRLFGEICHGIQETEEMMFMGTGLVGIGEIVLEDSRLKLRPPEHARYFLTRMSKNQLVRQIKSRVAPFKVFTILFGVVAASFLGYWIWRQTKKYLAYRKTQSYFEEYRRIVLRRRAEARNDNTEETDQLCVVCLVNPREVVILDCGHISVCCDCAEKFPSPQKCPVCRADVQRFLPLYMS